jgi:hypothetical protein
MVQPQVKNALAKAVHVTDCTTCSAVLIPSCCNQYGRAALTNALTQGGGGWATARSRSPPEHLLQHFKFRSLSTSALPSRVPEPNTLQALSPSQHIHQEPRNTLCMHFPDIQNSTAPFEGSQASPARPYDNSITYVKTSMEQEYRD